MQFDDYELAWIKWSGCYVGGWQPGDLAICTAFIGLGEAKVELVEQEYLDAETGQPTGIKGIHWPEYPAVKIIWYKPRDYKETMARDYPPGKISQVHWSHLKKLPS